MVERPHSPADEIVEAEVEVVNQHGLHARPAHKVVVTANRFPCAVLVIKDELEVDAKSIMSLLLLAAQKGTRLRIRAKGPKAAEAVESMTALFQAGFED